MHHILKFTITMMLYCQTSMCIALSTNDHFLDLPDLPPSLSLVIESQAVVNAATGHVRFVARADDIASAVIAHLTPYERQQIIVVRTVGEKLVCECSGIEDNEYLVSERPIVEPTGGYISINDESYKALLEMMTYPLDQPAFISVAFAELAYVYNADALNDFLRPRGFVLEMHDGMMNSDNFPGYRDTEYFVASDRTHRYVAIRGTSGARDAETSVDAESVPFNTVGMVHRGYLDVARHVLRQTLPFIRENVADDKRLSVVGHSLGGSVALIYGMLLAKAGVNAETMTYAPVPFADPQVVRHFDDILQATNYFLPNEELGGLSGRGEWFSLPGTRQLLPDVGKTAGAAHFVINYLRSMLEHHGKSRVAYEDSLPNCVVEKYPCFTDGIKENFISGCAFSNDSCFARQQYLLFGHAPEATLDKNALDLMIDKSIRMLATRQLSDHHHRVHRYRLAWLMSKQGNQEIARKLIGAGDEPAGGFHRYLLETIGNPPR